MQFEKPKINTARAAYNSEELAVDVGTNIFAARTKKGWTQKRLAEEMKTLQPSIARVENGNTLPSLDFLMKTAKALDTGLIAPTIENVIMAPSTTFSQNASHSYSGYCSRLTPSSIIGYVSSPFSQFVNQ